MPGATFEPLAVVVVPFPFTDRQATRRRPALVVSSRDFNGAHDQVILAMITTASRSEWPSDIRLHGWRAAGLTAPCRVRFKLFTLDANFIERRLGSLTAEDRAAVVRRLRSSLAGPTA